MKHLVVFTEEPSMKAALEEILPKVGITGALIIPHQGVSDLEKSLPRKLRSWRDENARFLVLRDNDNGDCQKRKQRLLDIVRDAGKLDSTKVRIVCQELEAWFIGDTEALRTAGLVKPAKLPASLRGDPDKIPQPVSVLRSLRADYQKTSGATDIARVMEPSRNRSASFHATMEAAKMLVGV